MLQCSISPSGFLLCNSFISEYFKLFSCCCQSIIYSTCVSLRGRHCLQLSQCQFILTASQLPPPALMWNLWTSPVSKVIPQPGVKLLGLRYLFRLKLFSFHCASVSLCPFEEQSYCREVFGFSFFFQLFSRSCFSW